MCSAFDLLNKNSPVTIDPKIGELNPACIEINEISDLIKVIDTIDAIRITVATKMNSGSSRSHAALILTLH